ncbi:MAG: hypothetical protein RR620_02485 [Clostridium sp.]
MNITPCHEYLLVLTDGSAIGFDDLETAKGYVNIYYQEKVKNSEQVLETEDITDSSEQLMNTVCQVIGAVEGEVAVYYIEDVINKIQEEFVFDEEKEEIVSKLLQKDIKLNVIDFGIDFILHDVEPIDIMEPYGER